MKEADKAAIRRAGEPVFSERYFVGEGIDIGAGEAPLSAHRARFPRMTGVRSWDVDDGDAEMMAGVPDEAYDFVHSSHCLEHLEDPRRALRQWLRILRPGGYLVVSVPDEDLYERGRWPSRFNPDHKWSFTIWKANAALPNSLNVLELIRELGDEIECERVLQVRDRFDERIPDHIDQTLYGAECAIEWVWRKRLPVAVSRRSAWQLIRDGYLMEQEAEDDAAAEQAYKEALCVDPGAFDAYNLLAHLLTRLKRYEEVEILWREAVRRIPSNQVRIYQALYLLQLGRFQEGFRIREASIVDARRTPTLPDVTYPRWQGERLTGRSIVIWTEFGFGDEIMFSRFAKDFKQTLGAARVSVLCQDALHSLLSRTLEGADVVLPVSRRAELPSHDFWVFPHSIPVYRALTEHTIPNKPYLRMPERDDGSRPEWANRAYKVGLVWKGDPLHENDANRSFRSLEELAPILDSKGITFVSLQKGRAEAEAEAIERQASSRSFYAAGGNLKDFNDTATLIAELDLVISVDTAVAHLAAAMGKAVWLLLPTVCDWRWMLDREDSLWYPTMRIFRQARLGQWQPVLERVSAELKAMRVASGAAAETYAAK